ncbi:MAG: serine/threonine-protein kinase [Planctomycetota bacterium]
MNQTESCPTTSTLGALVQGDLPEAEQQKWTEHVGLCEACQNALESLATADVPVVDLVAAAADVRPPAQSAYWPAIQQLEQTPPPHFSASGGDTANYYAAGADTPTTEDLPFLDPPNDPAYLGRLGNFEIARVIGRGGMGIVLEGFDTHLQRRVAIKVLKPELQQNDLARQRFCREGRAAAAISHEHVVAMHHVAKADEGKAAFLVMQLIEGHTLDTLLVDGKPLPSCEVARLGMQISAGLSAAHAQGMVHRDIKPANVLIDGETGRAKLTDFGLARANDEVKLTQTGMVSGTPIYMSPEQTRGEEPDERSDLFSLGAVLYQMATGRSPFEAPTAIGVMKKVIDENPAPPHTVNPEVSRPLSDLITALLRKDPKKRPDSAAGVTEALAQIVTEYGPISPLQVPAVASSTVKRLSGSHRSMGSRFVNSVWAAAIVAALCLGGTLFVWQNGMTNDPATDAATEADYPVVVLPDNPGAVWSVGFAPDGNKLAAAVENGSVRVWDIDKAEVVRSFNAHRGLIWNIAYHPTQDLVATSGDDGVVKLWDANDFRLIREWQFASGVRETAFSPDGTRMVVGVRVGEIYVYDIEQTDPIAENTQPGTIYGVAWSHDGASIATVGSDAVVRVWDASTLRERQSLPGHKGPIYGVRFSPTDNRLATAGWSGDVRLWDTDTGQQVTTFTGYESDAWAVAFCADGQTLLASGQDGTSRIWDIASGTTLEILGGHMSAVHDISVDSERHRVATSGRDGTVRVWDLTTLAE